MDDLDTKPDEIAALCRQLAIRRLDGFGSAVSDFDVDHSDVDVLVEIGGGLRLHFALKDGPEQILGRSRQRPYFEARVRATRERLSAGRPQRRRYTSAR